MATKIEAKTDAPPPHAPPAQPVSAAAPLPAERVSDTSVETEPSIGELFRNLAQDTSVLVRKEVELARAEMRANMQSFAKDAGMIAAGGAVLLVAALVFTAFLVAAIGDLLGNEYWLGALIVGAVYAAIGGFLIARGRKGLQTDDLKPEQTMESLQADQRWAQAEVRQIKRDLT